MGANLRMNKRMNEWVICKVKHTCVDPMLKGNIIQHLRVRALKPNGETSFTFYITMEKLLNLSTPQLPCVQWEGG